MKSKLSSSKRHYGWVPDVPDHRDHLYAAPVEWLAKLPAKADLRAKCPPVYDQEQLGSCTANAIAAAIEFDQMKEKLNISCRRGCSSITTNARWKERSTPTAVRLSATGLRASVRKEIVPKRSGPTI